MSARIGVAVAYAAPGIEIIIALTLPAGATVAEAVVASGLRERCGLAPDVIAFAIHGQRADPDTPLADGDRVEITRPLQVDAKAAEHGLSNEDAKKKLLGEKEPSMQFTTPEELAELALFFCSPARCRAIDQGSRWPALASGRRSLGPSIHRQSSACRRRWGGTPYADHNFVVSVLAPSPRRRQPRKQDSCGTAQTLAVREPTLRRLVRIPSLSCSAPKAIAEVEGLSRI